jgi:hypothetical protein
MKTLYKEIGNLVTTKAAGAYSASTGSGQFRQLTPGLGQFVASTYFYLAGMSMEAKTLFFEAAGMQEVLLPSASNATVGDGVVVVDILSTSPLTDTEVINYAANGNFKDEPSSTLTFDQTVYGRVRIYNVDVDNLAGGYYILLSDNQSGSMSATASDRIYVYRGLSFGMTNSDGDHACYPARYILKADAKEEPEYQYIMRLARSYELQNEPDND